MLQRVEWFELPLLCVIQLSEALTSSISPRRHSPSLPATPVAKLIVRGKNAALCPGVGAPSDALARALRRRQRRP